jgi:hypothetical protein
MKNREQIEFNAMDVFSPDGRMPFWNRTVTLVSFNPDNTWCAAKSNAGKTAMINNMDPTDTFLCVWTGKYSSNIFSITHKELRELTK